MFKKFWARKEADQEQLAEDERRVNEANLAAQMAWNAKCDKALENYIPGPDEPPFRVEQDSPGQWYVTRRTIDRPQESRNWQFGYYGPRPASYYEGADTDPIVDYEIVQTRRGNMMTNDLDVAERMVEKLTKDQERWDG